MVRKATAVLPGFGGQTGVVAGREDDHGRFAPPCHLLRATTDSGVHNFGKAVLGVLKGPHGQYPARQVAS
jgi:hypothetical protein